MKDILKNPWVRLLLVVGAVLLFFRLLWGLRAEGRGIPRPGMAVLDGTGERIGEVTSGTFSPTLRTGIALALLDTAAGLTEGDEVAVDVRGRPQPVVVRKPPFVESHTKDPVPPTTR